jgi:hypothetical protein
MSYSQYGLTAIDAEGADHEKGIVAAPDGKFYKIDGFKRNQKEGLDEDKGAAFDGKLQADSAAAGWDPSTFNTATDVENALKHLDGGGPTPENKGYHHPDGELEMSAKLREAKERAQNWTDSNGYAGQAYGNGKGATPGEVDYDEIQAYTPKKKSVK